ncbi:MAG: glycoside hydrolase family 16 protein [Myxococcota bacterium]
MPHLLLSMILVSCTNTPQPTQPPAPTSASASASTSASAASSAWTVDLFDDFDTFNAANWQDQLLWVNNEDQCYVPDGQHNTREVSNGTVKLRVVMLDAPIPCDNMDKHGKKHPDTRYVAGRLASKNRQEFVGGRWTARLRLKGSGQAGMFPAWWLLGAHNNEPPVQEADEDVCWPLEGSGEIDIFEHYGSGGADHYVARRIVSEGACDKGDWESQQKIIDADLTAYHDYGVEWRDGDLVYLLDGAEVYRNPNQARAYPEPLFAILNYAKVTMDPMTQTTWEMEVDWVKHESK